MNRTDRLCALVEQLRASAPSWRSAASLAEQFEVSTRTIERDLTALQQAGGSVVMPIAETPIGLRFAYVADPDGSVFGLWCPPAG